MVRKQIGKKIRFEVFKRDGFACQYCGATPPEVILHVDHIHPVSKGGDNDFDNLITACSDCNHGKGAEKLSSVPKSIADRADEIREQEDQIKGYTKVLMAQKKRVEKDVQRVCDALAGFENASCDDEIKKTIRMFCNKMHPLEVLDAAQRANEFLPEASMSTFKYFCGICWNMIKERQ